MDFILTRIIGFYITKKYTSLHTFSLDPAEELTLETGDVESDADVVVVEGRAVSRAACGCGLGLGNPAGN